uniref:Replication factor A protein 3 n=1 Tax=Eucampia antarctica TaxID=49252 RepID=A0A7S2RCY3_9STRA|mmetsp:Transcript_20536/g.19779  ORF Transcript_20536/g.19779 Transcript_20536/m.19779 type:complete len:119 (+) Transcript_20536:69-425(+)|eukprot:CAMPEP_0197828750 /NCGR_PEP_ID=MMETSP1437-20131217/5285_1 /TAXON_ID=49252 ORGANISM="Eucampia antarctica, Strain CCMP1452" /NCGR_SAMPLE_ID=MMETSP1437 /ASSEMBLY_ACC=CAM_ASM_001096 /LENGTH=118 /DNA_ID=CAMNT_0043430107 /DNA_START=69 /DNA_END=425 /DNA_ORIENTATION=-
MAEQSQPDGWYSRVNSSMIQSGNHKNLIVSIAGTLESTDGTIVNVRSVDKGSIPIQVEPDFEFQQGKNVEIIGSVSEQNSVQSFVVRDMGSDFDPEIYNEMIQMQQDPKYAEYFSVPK